MTTPQTNSGATTPRTAALSPRFGSISLASPSPVPAMKLANANTASSAGASDSALTSASASASASASSSSTAAAAASASSNGTIASLSGRVEQKGYVHHQTSKLEPTYASMRDYVDRMDGKRAITKVLIANNGIAAVKAIRSIKKWCYEAFGNEKVVSFVAMATPEDIAANAEYIHLADEFARVPGGPNNHNYANVKLIVELAIRHGADAVWAGWGHASENPRLPDALRATASLPVQAPVAQATSLQSPVFGAISTPNGDASSLGGSDGTTNGLAPGRQTSGSIDDSSNAPLRPIVWIGPPASAMRALGDKIGSTLIAQSANVSCMAWSGSGLTVSYAKSGIPDQVYKRACVHSAEDAREAAAKIGLPVMIKASEGGGGKGIRKVELHEDIEMAFRQVQGEVPGSPVFIMKLAPVARHLEVQLLADEWGDAIAIFGRDCSIQRRHQKIMEEGPVVAAPPEVWYEMEQAAVRLAREVGYVGAGTVEYLYTPGGEYYFLELNPRLQVEHPVTELISGVNLPAAQLQVAMGIPLHRVVGVRRMYGRSPFGDSKIDFETERPTAQSGHVIACRITAENPDASFQPTSGGIQELNFRSTPDVWGYFSVGSHGGVHEFSDSQFGHLFALGETREHARRNMIMALKELSIRGDIRTTIEHLPKVLENEDFIHNRVHTTWLEKVMKDEVRAEKPDTTIVVLLGALFRGFSISTHRTEEYIDLLSRGQLPSRALHSALIRVPVKLLYDGVRYNLMVNRSGPNNFDVMLADRTESDQVNSAEVHKLADQGLLILLGGRKYVIYGHDSRDGTLRLVVDGQTCMFAAEYDPSQLRSEMAGKLVRYLVQNGQHVEKNEPYAETEVMKMYVTLRVPEAGAIHLVKPPGTVLETGDLLARLTLDDPSRVAATEDFKGALPVLVDPQNATQHADHELASAVRQLSLVLSGYKSNRGVIAGAIDTLMRCLRNPSLPLLQFESLLAPLGGRIPEPLYNALQTVAVEYAHTRSNDHFFWERPKPFPVMEIQSAIEAYLIEAQSDPNCDMKALDAVKQHLAPVAEFVHRFRGGVHTNAVHTITALLQEYYSIEHHFSIHTASTAVQRMATSEARLPEAVIRELRQVHKKELNVVAEIARAHHLIEDRNDLVVALIDIVNSQLSPLVSQFLPTLHELAHLVSPASAPVALKARELIMRQDGPSLEQRRIAVETILRTAARKTARTPRRVRLAPLVDQGSPIEDLIFSFFEHPVSGMRHAAMESYVRRVYRGCDLFNVDIQDIKLDSSANALAHSKSRSVSIQAMMPSVSSNPGAYGYSAFAAAAADPTHHRSASHSTGDASDAIGFKIRWEFQTQRQRSVESKSEEFSGGSGDERNSPPRSNSRPGSNRGGDPAYTVRGSIAANGQRALPHVDSFTDFQRLDLDSYVNGTAGSSAVANGSAESLSVNAHGGFHRIGVLAYFRNYDDLATYFASAMTDFPRASPASVPESDDNASVQKREEPVHVLYVACRWNSELPSDEQLIKYLSMCIKNYSTELNSAQIRRVTFIIVPPELVRDASGHAEYPAYFTFRQRNGFSEDPTVRHIEPTYATYMEMQRLSNFDVSFVPTRNRMVHLFAAHPKNNTVRPRRGAWDGRRYFARVLIRNIEGADSSFDVNSLDAHPEAEAAFVSALNSLEVAIGSGDHVWRNNHIFVYVLVESGVDVPYIEAVIRVLARRYASKINQLRVGTVEFALQTKHQISDTQSIPLRYVCTNPTGCVLEVNGYVQRRDPQTREVTFESLDARNPGPWHGQTLSTPYPVWNAFDRQREAAGKVGTTYVYDFLILFRKALRDMWRVYRRSLNANSADAAQHPAVLLHSSELVIAERKSDNAESHDTDTDTDNLAPYEQLDRYELIESDRAPGKNDVGMVAWKLTVHTPDHPQGRGIVLIANDISFQAGTFGTREDLVFQLASQYARANGIPRLYFAANSGARIGLATELQSLFQVCWKNNDASLGLDYIYLNEKDYEAHKAHVKVDRRVVDNDEVRYVITDIIGRNKDIGVENLCGSGMIAGETSRAYSDIFTLSFVTGRTVGIGAYLVRLGHRTIQKQNPPILLTGYNALNKLLGREVYASNVQLGGTEIMYTNGVSHLKVTSDLEGVLASLRWLSYVPERRTTTYGPEFLRRIVAADPVDRPIRFAPTKAPHDPRLMFTGCVDETTGDWLDGFFDRNSFFEVLGGWARSVVTGRARLGGIPVGVIGVETRTTECIVPADPAVPESKEQLNVRAGQVWYPDSAYKTSQAIQDMVAEDVPLFIFANWRGFSGGMQDMYNEVLKFGSYIVDRLREYRQPIFVYIPPFGELRGGAWVVVDTSINPQYMEMYADCQTRGGVLEPAGTVDVKFRRPAVVGMMRRSDEKMQALVADLDRATAELKAAQQALADTTSNSSVAELKQQQTPAPTLSFFQKIRKKALPDSKTSSSSSTAGTVSPSDDIARLEGEIAELKVKLAEREKLLLPLYVQVATVFCDLHDTPGRMHTKSAIRKVVPWKGARTHFYWRLRRRLLECHFSKQVLEATNADRSDFAAVQNAKRTLVDIMNSDSTAAAAVDILASDRLTAEWIESHGELLRSGITKLRTNAMSSSVNALLSSVSSVDALSDLLSQLPSGQVDILKQALSKIQQ
jgi:acetyl-CoA carboxylase / biotin carboxylase 1